tara:strand:- start:7 stop:693 length:687 start_codon:yes stop_codon:yes gene_type:complete
MEEVIFLKRYKRFLADIENSKGRKETVYCPNTGAMTGCDIPNSKAWISDSYNDQRKYRKTLEFVETFEGIIGIRSVIANKLVEEAIANGVLIGSGTLEFVRSEPKIPGQNGRFDFLYSQRDQEIYIEVKSVSWLVDKQVGIFPDSVSARALKHIDALCKVREDGHRSMLIFCAQHTGIKEIKTALETDPDYCDALAMAIDLGVEVRALGCSNDLLNYNADREISFKLS